MLKQMSVLLSKNPEKLLSLYNTNEDKEFRLKIIDKLKSIKSYSELIKIAQIDEELRESVITGLLKNNIIDEHLSEKIFSWLNVCKLHSDVINYIKMHFSKEQVIYLLHSTSINPNAKKNIEHIYALIEKNAKEQLNKDERYLRLKMIYEDVDISDEILDNAGNNFDAEINMQEIIVKFLKDIKEKDENDIFEYIANTIYEIKAKLGFKKSVIFLFANLANLNLNQRIKLIKHCKDNYVYFPDIFNMLTEFKTVAYDPLHHLFSAPVVKKWVEEYLESGYYLDLLFLSKNFPEFSELNSVFEKSDFHKFIDLVKIDDKHDLNSDDCIISEKLLSKKYKLFLTDLIIDKKILDILQNSSLNIQKNIIDKLNKDDSMVKTYLNALNIVGGDYNLEFIKLLLRKKPSENVEQTYKEIEQKFLEQKKSSQSPESLKQLVEQEIKEKSEIISIDLYNYIIKTLIEFISILSNFSTDNKNILKNCLEITGSSDDKNEKISGLTYFIQNSGTDGRILACQLIAKLELTGYIPQLEKFLSEKDIRTAIYSSMALKTLNVSSADNYIKKFLDSQKTAVKKELASLIHIFKKNLNDENIIKLACDENSVISEEALKSIAKLPKNKALSYYEQIVANIPGKTKIKFAEILGETKSKRAIPLLIELLNKGDFFDYKAVIKALVEIKDPMCLELLQNMELNRNFTLELERCRGLIVLGDYKGWDELKKFFNLNQGNISFIAKMYFIELANYEQLDIIRNLVYDPDNKISSLAVAKILYFNENEGLKIINEILDNNNYDKIYYTSQLLNQFPFEEITNELQKLSQKENIKCKIIFALLNARNSNRKLITSIERSVMSFNDNQNKEILQAIKDFPTFESFSIIKKIALMQNQSLNEEIFELLSSDAASTIVGNNVLNDFFIELWNSGELSTRKLILDFVRKGKNTSLFSFFKKEFDNNLNQVQVHIAALAITYGEDDYWQFLEQMTMSEDNEVRFEAIEAISKIDEKKALNILSRLLSSPSEMIQAEIVKTLSNSPSREIIPLLQKLLESNSSKVKIAVAKTLGSFPYSESKRLLEKLKMEKDEYVLVTADIALEKIEKNTDFYNTPFYILLSKILGVSNLSINEDFINHNYNLLKTQYAEFQSHELSFFIGKTIVDYNSLDSKIKKIDDELEKKLTGNTDVDSIVSLKEIAEKEKEKFCLREELLISIIELNLKKLTNEEAQIIFDILKTENETYIKAFLLATAMLEDVSYLTFYDKILNMKDSYKYLEYILYSITKKLSSKSGKNISMISAFLDNDKVKYYFVFLINFYIIHPALFKKEKAQELLSKISSYNIDKEVKKSAIDLITFFAN